jgi:hypothetical protein
VVARLDRPSQRKTRAASRVSGDNSAGKSQVIKEYCPNATCGSNSGPGYISGGATLAGMGTYQTTSYGASSLSPSAPTTIKALQTNEVYRVDLVWTLNTGP